MANPQLSEESKEKIAMVFQNYAVNPVGDRVGKALKELEKKIISPDHEGCLEDTLLEKSDSISKGVSSIKKNTNTLQETLNNTNTALDKLENRLLKSETEECLETVLHNQFVGITNSISAATTDLDKKAVLLQNTVDKANVSINALANRLVDVETDSCLEKVLRDQATSISHSISKAKTELAKQTVHLQNTVDNASVSIKTLEHRLVDAETDTCLENLLVSETKAIATSISTLHEKAIENQGTLTSISAQITESIQNTSKSVNESTASAKSTVTALQTHLDAKAQEAENAILVSVENRKFEIVNKLEAIYQDISNQHSQLQTALVSIHTELDEKHQKHSQEQNDTYEQIKADILLAVAAESEKLMKMLRISWAISGVSILGLITTLIVLLVG